MRQLPRRILAIALFAAATAGVLAGLTFLLCDDVHAFSRVMMQELYAEAGRINTLFLGSSHCYRSVDPALVDAELADLGVSSFNAGSSQQLPDGSYYLLREAAAHNTLDTVYLEMYYPGYRERASADIPMSCYVVADYMDPASPNRYAWLWEMGGPAVLPDLLLPFRHNLAELGKLPELWRAKLTDGYAPGNYAYVTYPEDAYLGRGFVAAYTSPQYGFTGAPVIDGAEPLSAFGWENLQRITAFCEQNGIRLVLFTAPLPGAYVMDANYQPYVDALRSYAAENGLEYWDFTLYRNYDMVMEVGDFSDAHHLSAAGAEKFTRALCRVISAAAKGEPVNDWFFATLAEKVEQNPDETMLLYGY